MSRAVAALLSILDLEKVADDSFRGACAPAVRKRVFGGQIISPDPHRLVGVAGKQRRERRPGRSR